MKKLFLFALLSMAFLLPTQFVLAQDDILEGKITFDDLRQEPFSSWFAEFYNSAHPNDGILSKTKPLLKDKKITIVMGTWCGDSKRWVPYFSRMLDLMKYDEKNVEIIAINKKKMAKGIDMSKYHIERIPTFIVYDKSGKELGRIVESPAKTLEEDLYEILMKNAKE
jgi:thiol-disulfide isomerase/thioredoxin